jgi:glyoxylase-like metal-dependent hydrolase (beta-lactamase superfamily II)
MAEVISLTFNPFQENTYIVYDDSKECIIVDPGCHSKEEENRFLKIINEHQLSPVRLLNTHCHIDHVFGNKFIAETFGLRLEIHEGELPVLKAAPQSALMFGMALTSDSFSPPLADFLVPGEKVVFGNTELEMLFTPGHSPASISFYDAQSRFVLAGDVLFHQSIGRTDLPGGDYNMLLKSIRTELLPLEDDIVVYPGHGPATSIGYERQHNPFLNNG